MVHCVLLITINSLNRKDVSSVQNSSSQSYQEMSTRTN